MVDVALVVGASVAGAFVVIVAALVAACCIYMQRHPRKKKRVTPIHQSTEKIRRKADELKQKKMRQRRGCFSCCLGSRQQLHDVLDLPESPRGLQLRSHGPVEVTLSWKPPIADSTAPPTTHFKVYKRRQRQLNGWMDVATVTAEIYEHQFEKTESDRKHVWGVSTKNKNGESRIVEIQPVKLNKVQASLSLPPFGLELHDPEPRSITLGWRPPREDEHTFAVTQFQLYARKVTDKTGWEEAATVKSDILEYRFTKLITGKKYVFGVSATNKFGESSIVQTAPTKMNKKPVLPGRPSGLSIRDQQSDNLTLSWGAPLKDGNDRITTYHVMTRTGRGEWKHTETLKAFDRDNYCKIHGMGPGISYLFKVAAENSVGVGGYAITNEVVLEAAAEPSDKPLGPLKYKKITHKSVTLSWQPPKYDGGAQVSGYAIEQLDERSPNWQHVGVCGGETTRFTVTKIPEDIDVRFHVVAMNIAGNSQPLRGSTTRTKLLTIPTFKKPLVQPEVPFPRRRRSRTVYSRDATERMEEVFSTNPYPDVQQRETLAADLGVLEARVQVWFQNRRARRTKRRADGQGDVVVAGTRVTKKARTADKPTTQPAGAGRKQSWRILSQQPSLKSHMAPSSVAAETSGVAPPYNAAITPHPPMFPAPCSYQHYFLHPYLERHGIPAVPPVPPFVPATVLPQYPVSPALTVTTALTPARIDWKSAAQTSPTCGYGKQQQSAAIDYSVVTSGDTYLDRESPRTDSHQRHIIISRNRPVQMIFPMPRATTCCYVSELRVSEERGDNSSGDESHRGVPNERSMTENTFSFESLGSSCENDSGISLDS